MNKLFKYKLLRFLPGEPGRRYERKILRLHAHGKEFDEALSRSRGMTCIDLGANVGEYTRRMAAGAKRVIAFEPDPWSHAALQANTAHLDNVRIEYAAAGTGDGKVLLYRHARFAKDPAKYSESSSVIADKSNVSREGAVEVRQVDFIRFLADLDEDIGILKIDIEGAEVELLEALFERPEILARIAYVFAETHETRIPGHKARVNALRERACTMKRPCVNLNWH